MKTVIAIFGIVLFACGCANRPETIHASFVSHERFTGLDCIQLVNKMSSTRSELDKFSRMQDSKATGDAWGVFLIGVPFSKLSGDHEGDVARLKGEVEAIETAQIKNKCADGGGRTLTSMPYPPSTGGTATSTTYAPQAPDRPTIKVENGQDTLTAERYAKDERCSVAPRASLIAKGAGFETYSLQCASGDTMLVRCEFGNCRALR